MLGLQSSVCAVNLFLSFTPYVPIMHAAREKACTLISACIASLQGMHMLQSILRAAPKAPVKQQQSRAGLLYAVQIHHPGQSKSKLSSWAGPGRELAAHPIVWIRRDGPQLLCDGNPNPAHSPMAGREANSVAVTMLVDHAGVISREDLGLGRQRCSLQVSLLHHSFSVKA